MSGAIKPLRTVVALWHPAFPIPSWSNTRTRVTHIMTGALRQFPVDRSLIIEVNDTADERDSQSSCFRGSWENECVHSRDEPAERLPVFALETLQLAHMLQVSIANLEHRPRAAARNLMRFIQRAAWQSCARARLSVVQTVCDVFSCSIVRGFCNKGPLLLTYSLIQLQSKLLRIEIPP